MKKPSSRKHKKRYFNQGDAQRYSRYFSTTNETHFFLSSGVLLRIPLIIFPIMLLVLAINTSLERNVLGDGVNLISHVRLPHIPFPDIELSFRVPHL